MTWYKQRSPQKAGAVRRHVGISLSPEAWGYIERSAMLTEQSVAFTISHILYNWALSQRGKQDDIDAQAKKLAAELFAADKDRNGDDSWRIAE